jgi:D-alanyl-D-alanine carboxypeptidase
MLRSHIVLALPLALFAGIHQGPTAPVVSQEATSASERIAARCQPVLDALIERGVPGVSVGLILPDGGELGLTAGYSFKEEELDLLPEHRLLLGSVGKTYVTAAVHHLVQAEKLSLHDYAADYFAEEDWIEEIPNAGEITIRQLLRHQTGIPRYVFKEEFWAAVVDEPDRTWKPVELLEYVFGDAPLFPAGEGWAYADTNYIVLGMIIEKVSGETFYGYVDEHLLKPHGLKDTVPSDSREIPGLVQGYVVSPAMRSLGVPERTLVDGVFVFNPQFEWTGGGYACTPLDLARWAAILYSGEAFDGPYLETMLDTVPARQLGPGREYGLGVIVTPSDMGPFIGHDGFMPGYETAMGYLPDVGIAVAVQVNTDDGRAVGKPLPMLAIELAKLAAEELGE